jgi:hypothetical protein
MDKHVVEYAGVPVGIIVPDKDRFRFIAVKFHVYELNDRHFASALEVHLAIHNLMTTDSAQAALAA